MKSMKRALRRSHRRRLIARVMKFRSVIRLAEAERLPRAVRRYNNRQYCTCAMCAHWRKRYGPPAQELRLLEAAKYEREQGYFAE